MMKTFPRVLAFATACLSCVALAQSSSNQPWRLPDPILILDPYQANRIDWNKVAADKAVKAIIHRAYFGLTPDTKYVERVAEAKRRGLLAGLYLLGRPGDPIKQADALIAAGAQTGVSFLALDIENMDPARSMTLADAARFLDHVHRKTGRYPAFYTNFSTYRQVSAAYGPGSVFARTPLWLARFRATHGMQGTRVWKDYAIWQFQSEINCTPNAVCPRRVAGTDSDMDVNVFGGDEAALRQLFGAD